MTVDEQRFERLYSEHYVDVLRYCLRRTPRADAADAAAETFGVAWRRRSDIPNGCELPWLYGVARRVLANHRRSSHRLTAALTRLGREPSMPGHDPESLVVRSQEAEAVQVAIGRLPIQDQEIIRLAGWEELDRNEIAIAMGCTPNAVTKRLGRALDRLAHELGVVERSGGRFFSRGKVRR